MVTHRCKNLEAKKYQVTSRDNQEIHGGVLADLDKKARRTTDRVKTSTMTFRRVYDDKQCQGVFDTEGMGYWGMSGGKHKEHTVHQRKHKVDHLFVFPYWVEADVVLIVNEVGEYHRF